MDIKDRAKELRRKGDMFRDDEDYEKAMDYYQESAKLGDVESMFQMGMCLFRIDKIGEAVRWFIDAGDAGDSAGYAWAFYVFHGEPEDGEIEDDFALEAVGIELLRSYDDEDFECGMRCLEKSFRMGNPSAAYQIGMYYFEGTCPCYDEALKWFTIASDAGFTLAQVNLGHMYLHGFGVVKSDEKACELFSRAAELGNDKAQYNIGLQYYSGEGVEKSFEKAAYWFAEAVKKNHPASCFMLACQYYKGEGVEKSIDRFIELLGKGAELDNLDCIHFLGEEYETGNAVEKDIDRAIKLYTKAARRGYKESVKALKRLEKKKK